MKLNRFVLPLALALIAALATTGCKSKLNPGNTKLPLHTAVPTGTGTPEPLPDTKPIDTSSQTPVVTPQPYLGGPIGTSTNWNLTDYIQYREKLAAYTVHFKFDSAVVEDSEKANVASVAEALKADANARLLIEGHCDERGTEEYNRSLGERRALALREALATAGVNAELVRTVSYGKDKPLDPGHDEAAWAKNRRGVFIWCTPKNPAP